MPCLDHHLIETPFCARCGVPVKPIQREPGELRAFLGRLPGFMAEAKATGDPGVTITMVCINTGVNMALKWALGELQTDRLETICRPQIERSQEP